MLTSSYRMKQVSWPSLVPKINYHFEWFQYLSLLWHWMLRISRKFIFKAVSWSDLVVDSVVSKMSFLGTCLVSWSYMLIYYELLRCNYKNKSHGVRALVKQPFPTFNLGYSWQCRSSRSLLLRPFNPISNGWWTMKKKSRIDQAISRHKTCTIKLWLEV